MRWRQAVIHAISREVEESGSEVFSRSQLLRNQMATIVRLTGSSGKTPDQTVSRVLQELRDEGPLTFQGNGVYAVDVAMLDQSLDLNHPFNNLDIGHKYLRREIAPLALRHGYGKLTAGITPKGTFPATESVVIFADVGRGRYGNFWDEETGDLLYVGEDDSRTFGKQAKTRDQNHAKGKNRVLTNQGSLGYPLYLFTRAADEEPFTYRGICHVVEFDYFHEEGRRVVRYRLRPLDVSSSQVDFQLQVLAERDMLKRIGGRPVLEEPAEVVQTTSFRKYRSRAFSIEVRASYEDTCAVCGEARYNYKDHPEVDAAHIYPVARNGSNDVRNGIALCKFHHWAFDGHLFYVSRDLRVVPTFCGLEVNGVREFAQERLSALPSERKRQPHELFLAARQELVPAFLMDP